MRIGALALGLVLFHAPHAHGACDTVPAYLVTRAGVYAIAAAQMLVEAGCTVGLEVRRRDFEEFQKPSPRRWNPWDANREHFAKDRHVPLGDFIHAFNAAHESYGADARDGIVLIRPVSDRAPYLEQRPLRGTLTAKGLFIMLATLTEATLRRVSNGSGSFTDSDR